MISGSASVISDVSSNASHSIATAMSSTRGGEPKSAASGVRRRRQSDLHMDHSSGLHQELECKPSVASDNNNKSNIDPVMTTTAGVNAAADVVGGILLRSPLKLSNMPTSARLGGNQGKCAPDLSAGGGAARTSALQQAQRNTSGNTTAISKSLANFEFSPVQNSRGAPRDGSRHAAPAVMAKKGHQDNSVIERRGVSTTVPYQPPPQPLQHQRPQGEQEEGRDGEEELEGNTKSFHDPVRRWVDHTILLQAKEQQQQQKKQLPTGEHTSSSQHTKSVSDAPFTALLAACFRQVTHRGRGAGGLPRRIVDGAIRVARRWVALIWWVTSVMLGIACKIEPSVASACCRPQEKEVAMTTEVSVLWGLLCMRNEQQTAAAVPVGNRHSAQQPPAVTATAEVTTDHALDDDAPQCPRLQHHNQIDAVAAPVTTQSENDDLVSAKDRRHLRRMERRIDQLQQCVEESRSQFQSLEGVVGGLHHLLENHDSMLRSALLGA